jgi:hypothetical protein
MRRLDSDSEELIAEVSIKLREFLHTNLPDNEPHEYMELQLNVLIVCLAKALSVFIKPEYLDKTLKLIVVQIEANVDAFRKNVEITL